jgi:hypothetical protein
MTELLRRGFAPIATVLSFIAEERSAGIDQATSGLLSPANSDPILKPGRSPKPCDDFRRFNSSSADTDPVSDLLPDEYS